MRADRLSSTASASNRILLRLAMGWVGANTGTTFQRRSLMIIKQLRKWESDACRSPQRDNWMELFDSCFSYFLCFILGCLFLFVNSVFFQ